VASPSTLPSFARSRPLTSTSEPCESYAKTQKIDRYASAFEKSDYDFAPVVFETSGAVNKEGEKVLKQIIRFASKREGITHTVSSLGSFILLCSVLCRSADSEPRLCRSDTSRRHSHLNSIVNCFTDFILLLWSLAF
jgi:hypothetical protein